MHAKCYNAILIIMLYYKHFGRPYEYTGQQFLDKKSNFNTVTENQLQCALYIMLNYFH